jgi:hypothetical protein
VIEPEDLTDASMKSDRYGEFGFIVVPFAEIRAPLPPSPATRLTP